PLPAPAEDEGLTEEEFQAGVHDGVDRSAPEVAAHFRGQAHRADQPAEAHLERPGQLRMAGVDEVVTGEAEGERLRRTDGDPDVEARGVDAARSALDEPP